MVKNVKYCSTNQTYSNVNETAEQLLIQRPDLKARGSSVC